PRSGGRGGRDDRPVRSQAQLGGGRIARVGHAVTKPRWLAVASRSDAAPVSCVARGFGVVALLAMTALLASCRRSTTERGSAADAASLVGVGPTGTGADVGAPGAMDAGSFRTATRRACRVMALHGTATSRPRWGAAPTPSGE